MLTHTLLRGAEANHKLTPTEWEGFQAVNGTNRYKKLKGSHCLGTSLSTWSAVREAEIGNQTLDYKAGVAKGNGTEEE